MQVLNIFHVLVAIGLIVFVLIQKGQGATAGAAFGSGASGTVFGARGAGNFLSRSTWVLAALFCTISLTMAVMVSRIMSAPETDLGVVSAAQEAPVAEQGPQIEQVTVGPNDPVVTDIPSFDPADDAAESNIMNSTEGEDLPAMDEAVDTAVAEDIPAVENGEENPGPGVEDG